MFGNSELLVQEDPSSLNDFKNLARRVAEDALKGISREATGAPHQVKRAYEEIHAQLMQTGDVQRRGDYVAGELRVLNSLQRLAVQAVGAETVQGFNFANYLVVPIANKFLKLKDYAKALDILKQYGHSSLLTKGIAATVMDKKAKLLDSVDLVLTDTTPEFYSASSEDATVTIITQYREEGSKDPTHWMVNSKVNGQPFWNVTVKRLDKASADYQQGTIKTKSLVDALTLAWAANEKNNDMYANALGMIVYNSALNARSPKPL